MPAIELFEYQRQWLKDKSRFKVGCWARQVGKTFCTTLEIVNDCLDAEAEGRRARWVILSRGERQAKEAMDEGVKRHLEAYGTAFEALEYDWDPQTKALEVRLPGGSRITALPANPDTARGFSANVFLDEFAFHADSRKIWTALFPVISAGHRLIVVSTPNGKGNKFYDLLTSDDDAWSRHRVDIHRAVADGLPRQIEELRTGINDADAWAQEYELQWLDEASAWLPFDLINGCEDPAAGDPAHYGGGPCFLGVDIGRRGDLWVCWVLERVGDVLWAREVVELKNAPFAAHDAELHRIMQGYHVVRCAMDQTGMGEKPVEDAQRRYGSTRVEGVLFGTSSKLELATVGKETFEDRRVRIPAGRPELRADLHKLRKVPSETGRPRFLASRDEAGHADRTWSLFLGLYAASGRVVDWESWQRAGSPREAFSNDGLGLGAVDTGWGGVAGLSVDTRGF